MTKEEKEILRFIKEQLESNKKEKADLIIEFEDGEILLNLIEKQNNLIGKVEEYMESTEKSKGYLDKANFIDKDKIKAKLEQLSKEYDEILGKYGNIYTDAIINVPNKKVKKHLRELMLRIIIYQELLNESEK